MFKVVIHDAMSSIRMRLEQRIEPPLMMMRGIVNEAIMPGRLTIWAWDSSGGNDRRRAIYPGYKTRPPAPGQTYVKLDLLRELLSYTPTWQARLPGFEGDDIVAALVEHFRDQAPIEIITRDGDLTALCAGRGQVTCRAKCPVTPDLVPLYKLVVGDKSDTIKGIPGFGDKDWANADKPALAKILVDAEHRVDFTDEAAKAAGLRPPHIRWLRENPDVVNAMRRVIAPFEMSPTEFNACLSVGADNPEAREALMKRYML